MRRGVRVQPVRRVLSQNLRMPMGDGSRRHMTHRQSWDVRCYRTAAGQGQLARAPSEISPEARSGTTSGVFCPFGHSESSRRPATPAPVPAATHQPDPNRQQPSSDVLGHAAVTTTSRDLLIAPDRLARALARFEIPASCTSSQVGLNQHENTCYTDCRGGHTEHHPCRAAGVAAPSEAAGRRSRDLGVRPHDRCVGPPCLRGSPLRSRPPSGAGGARRGAVARHGWPPILDA